MPCQTRKIFKLIFVLLSFFYCQVALGEISRPLLTKLSTDEGLSQGSVKSLLQDNEGFIWLATKGGLDRFDGYQIKPINGPENVFADQYIQHLFQDSTGLFWVGTRYAGLYAFDLRKNQVSQFFTQKEKLERSSVNRISSIVEDDSQDLWISAQREVKLYDRATQRMQSVFSTRELKGKPSIRRLSLHDGILYIATTKGVYALDTQSRNWRLLTHIVPEVEPEKAFNNELFKHRQSNTKALHIDSSNNLWIGTVEGLYSLSTKNMRLYINQNAPLATAKLRMSARNIWRIFPDGDTLYLATDDGLYTFSPLTDSAKRLWRFSDSQFGLEDNNIREMLRDNQGNFWLASKSNSIYLWHPRSRLFYNLYRQKGAAEQLSHNNVNAVAEAADGGVWIGTRNGLNRYDKQTGQIETYFVSSDLKSTRTSGTVYQILQRGNGSFWLATGTKLVNFDPVKRQIVALKTATLDDQLALEQRSWDYSQDSHGRLWFKTKPSYYRYDPVSGQVNPLSDLNQRFPPGLASSFIGFLPRHNGMLFAAEGQVWLIDVDSLELQRVYQPQFAQRLERVESDSWVIDKNNILWLTFSGAGLIGLDADSFELKYHYDKSNKLATNSVFSVQLDSEGDLWLASYAGLMRMDADSHHVEHFTILDGLSTNEFSEGAVTRLKSGELIFGSLKGISWLSVDEVKRHTLANHNVKIVDFSLLSRDFILPTTALDSQEIELNYNDIGLKVEFSTLSYTGQQQVRYRYWLENERKVLYPETTENSIVFPQLDAGHYEFNVQAISPNSGQAGPATKLYLNIQHAPWASPLAYGIYISTLMMLLFLWLYKKRRQQQELFESNERLQLALDASDSAAWDWHAASDLIYQARLKDELSLHQLSDSQPMSTHVKRIHPQDLDKFQLAWKLFISGHTERFACDYRMQTVDGAWLWYRDHARIVEKDEQNKPARVTGTYTNITATRANEEKAKIFGEAFRKIRDWVMILDTQLNPIAINNSLCDALGASEQELFQAGSKLLGLSRKKQLFYRTLLKSLKPGQHWQGEEKIITQKGDEHPVLMNISAVIEEGQTNAFFVIVLTDISAQKAAENELRYLANYDHLTDLPNRSLLLDRIKHAMEQAHRDQNQIALFFIDLDRFKQVNDSLGHAVGDQFLQHVAQTLTQVLREGDTVARLGGDEFIVLLESFRSVEILSRIAQKIIDSVDKPVLLDGHRLSVTPSIGIALYPDDASLPADLIKQADIAMYHAKKSGRGQLQFFTSAMNQKVIARLDRENKVKQAHLNDEIINYYQPIVEANEGKVVGLELLLRWQSSEGIIGPGEFIPIAEDIGLIVPMTHAAISRGFADLKYWRYQLGQEIYLSINLSVTHLEQKELATQIKELLDEYQIAPSAVCLEITETALMKDKAKALVTMAELTDAGIKLALDDFGTGYSSLGYLKDFPIDIVKIDRSFVKDIGKNTQEEAIVEAILVMTKTLGLSCVAEGVENEEQLNYLSSLGCDMIQGFYFAKPMPAEKVIVSIPELFK